MTVFSADRHHPPLISAPASLVPLLMVVVSPANVLVPIVSAASLGFLALLGAVGAKAGGANILRATLRVTFWGTMAPVSPPESASFSDQFSETEVVVR
jgi:hypothetical protein